MWNRFRFVWALLVLVGWGATWATPACPATCQCSETFEDMFSITCSSLVALMLPNETLQVDCQAHPNDLQQVSLPSVPEVSLTSCQPDLFVTSETRSLFLRNLSSSRPVRVGEWPNLQKLDVSNNKLEILSTRFLSGLYGLKQLDLSKCQLHFLYPFCFHGFTLLKELYLEANELIEIDDNQFDQLSSLWLLHLWGNKLYRLSNSSFAGLVELRHLDLSHNRLKSISPAVLAPLKQLQHLDLSDNRFTTLPGDLLSHTRQLQTFKLEHNSQQSLAEPEAEWLQTIELPQGLLSDLVQLTWVSFAESAVAELPRFLLRGSSALVHLDLKGNQLTSIPKFFLQDAGKLKWLDLSSNRLGTLAADLLANLNGGTLLHLNLSENALAALPPGQVYQTLNMLDIRNNRLQSTTRDIVQQLRNSSHLRELFFARGNMWLCQDRFTKDLLDFAEQATFTGVATDFLGACAD